jgi:hypothetical protein
MIVSYFTCQLLYKIKLSISFVNDDQLHEINRLFFRALLKF